MASVKKEKKSSATAKTAADACGCPPNQQARYTMAQVSVFTGLPYETLRYYCRVGLIPTTLRRDNNYRLFSDDDVTWARMVASWRDCGLSHEQIKQLYTLTMSGEKTVAEREKILVYRRRMLESQKAQLEANIDFLNQQIKHYRQVAAGKEADWQPSGQPHKIALPGPMLNRRPSKRRQPRANRSGMLNLRGVL